MTTRLRASHTANFLFGTIALLCALRPRPRLAILCSPLRARRDQAPLRRPWQGHRSNSEVRPTGRWHTRDDLHVAQTPPHGQLSMAHRAPRTAPALAEKRKSCVAGRVHLPCTQWHSSRASRRVDHPGRARLHRAPRLRPGQPHGDGARRPLPRDRPHEGGFRNPVNRRRPASCPRSTGSGPPCWRPRRGRKAASSPGFVNRPVPPSDGL